MSDFHERLRQKKEQIAGTRPSAYVEPAPIESDWLSDAQEFMSKIWKLLATLIVGAAIFSLVVCSLIIKDWWTFIGSPEYHEWKARVEHGP